MFQFVIFSIDINELHSQNIKLISKVFFNCFKCTSKLLSCISNISNSMKDVNSYFLLLIIN